MIAPLLFLLAMTGGDRLGPLQPLGRLDHPAIREASGIVASRRHPGVFWVHNDSGNPPALFAVRRDGTLIREYAVNIPNIDWEDVASDDDGHLYLGEIGNNGGLLPVRAIYRLDEPDPTQPAEGKLQVTRASYYRFPPNGRFDAEGLFIDRGRAVVVAKTFDEREAELFAVPLDPAAPLIRPAFPERLGSLPGFNEPATGAALAVDGRSLAVCSYDVARVYHRDDRETDRWALVGTVRFEADGIEAIGWDGEDLILAGEGRGLFKIAAATGRAGQPAGAIPDPTPDRSP
jgi:hypothetical protein